jgi:peptide/nickel transport system ATP-binding protein
MAHDEGTGTGPLLEVADQTVDIDTPHGTIRPVDHVSFALQRRETLGIVGESGSGKSILVRSLMELLPLHATTAPESMVRFDGRDLRRLPRSERRHFWGTRMSMVFQDPMTSLNPTRTIGAQLVDPIRFHLGLGRRDARTRAVELLQRVHIPAAAHRVDQYPHELSGGMRQRVTIAIALACEPDLLIADEPTTALDVTVQRQILDLLDELQEDRHMAMILISHDLGLVAEHTDRIAVMYAGRFVEMAPASTMAGATAHPYTRALLASVPRLDHPSHTRMEAIEGRPPDLRRLPPGCSFEPRCRYATERCREERPRLDPLEIGHLAACFHPRVAETPVAAPGRTT